jgi:UDP-3-O-[3-hydroxymyristoyl] glucosamine N-acyltransferase
VANQKYVDHVANTRAGLIFVTDGVTGEGHPHVIVKNPQLAFAKILEVIEKDRSKDCVPGIHSTAIIAPTATLGKDVSIGPYVVIEAGAAIGDRTRVDAHTYIGSRTVIGNDCLVYPRVTIRENVVIGNRVIVHSGTVIGSDGFGFAAGETGPYKIPQIGSVELGDDVEIGANVTIDRATTGRTKIGRGTKIDNLVQIAHNVQIGEHCIIVAQVGISGSTHFGNFVTIGGQAGTVGHITVGDGATIAARSGVIGDIAPRETVSGYPARPHREAMKLQALIHRLPELFVTVKNLRKSAG